MTDQDHSPIVFDTALADLECLVAQLEQGDATLEETLQHFEQGVALVRNCQATLQRAEQRVEQLTERNGSLEIAPFTPSTD